LADPNSLYSRRPSVTKDCILDSEKIPTVGISAPQNPDVKVNLDSADLSWEEPEQTGDSPIVRYRVFISEKDSTGLPMIVTTNDAKTTYKVRFTKKMWGKDYVFSVLAINSNKKISHASE
jgi:hypothetical protein